MIKLAIGTTSEQKLSYVTEVLGEFGIEARLEPIAVDSGVSNQPTTFEETERGAHNRAEGALRDVPNATHGLGIEVGYHKNGDGAFEMFCVAVLCSEDDTRCREQSSTLVVPEYFQKILTGGDYVGDHVQMFHETAKTSEEKRMAETIRYRKPFIVDALRKVFNKLFNVGR